MHVAIYTFVMVIFTAAAAAAPSLHGSHTWCIKDVTFGNVSRKFIWIHVQNHIKIYIFLQNYVYTTSCLRDKFKMLHSYRENFPHVSLRSKGQANSWIQNNIMRTQNHSQLSPIFWYVIGHFCIFFFLIFFSWFHKVCAEITWKHCYDQIISCRKEKRKLTHSIFLKDIFFCNYYHCAWCAVLLLLLLFWCNVYSFAIFSTSTNNNNNNQWPYLTYNKTELCSVLYTEWVSVCSIWYGMKCFWDIKHASFGAVLFFLSHSRQSNSSKWLRERE